MEFIKVRFSQRRYVILDDAPSRWLTEETIPLDPGPHKVALALASDPSSPDPLLGPQIVLPENTTVISPLNVMFPKRV